MFHESHVQQKAVRFKVPNLVKTINLRKFLLSNSGGYQVEMTKTKETKDKSSFTIQVSLVSLSVFFP